MTKKITKATFKSFVRKNAENLMISTESDFDGMQDMVVSCGNRDFRPVTKSERSEENTLGIVGLWLVGGGRDYFEAVEKDGFKGIRVWNCCGSSVLAVQA